MIYLKLIPIVVLISVGAFVALGPGSEWLAKGKGLFTKNTGKIVSTNGPDVLGIGQGLGDKSKDVISITDAVNKALSPIKETSNSVEQAVDAVMGLPQNQIEAIRAQICNPQTR